MKGRGVAANAFSIFSEFRSLDKIPTLTLAYSAAKAGALLTERRTRNISGVTRQELLTIHLLLAQSSVSWEWVQASWDNAQGGVPSGDRVGRRGRDGGCALAARGLRVGRGSSLPGGTLPCGEKSCDDLDVSCWRSAPASRRICSYRRAPKEVRLLMCMLT
jgi:hypothetical protein